MFRCPCCRQQKNKCQNDVEVGDDKSSSPQKRVKVVDDPKQQTVFPDTPAPFATTVSGSKENAKKAYWRHRKKTKHQTPVKKHVAKNTNLPPSFTEKSVNTIKESEGDVDVQEASPTPDTPVSAATKTGKKNKSWCHWCLLSCLKKHKLESPVEGAASSPPPGTASVDPVEVDTNSESYNLSSFVISGSLPRDVPMSMQFNPTGHGGRLQDVPISISPCSEIDEHFTTLFCSARTESVSTEDISCLGLPNLAQTCYMNSALQGLLTLTHFNQEVHNQQEVWSFHPKSQLIRGFVDVGVCRISNCKEKKKCVLAAFKNTVAEFNPDFQDKNQKDAHEFLSCVLDRMRSLYVDLQSAAVDMGISYTCPVNAHIVFQMLSTRTCRGCGMQSRRMEDYINLSLDLVPGASVQQCLQNYMKEGQLDYWCECDAEESSQQWSFLTLPNVLILQLKRFRFTRFFNLEKVDSTVVLSRELVVNPDESSITKHTSTHYSLVSIISHLGCRAQSGHYICDGVHRNQNSGDATDRWLTYNDNNISETTGASVCHLRQQTAYLLFYERESSETSLQVEAMDLSKFLTPPPLVPSLNTTGRGR